MMRVVRRYEKNAPDLAGFDLALTLGCGCANCDQIIDYWGRGGNLPKGDLQAEDVKNKFSWAAYNRTYTAHVIYFATRDLAVSSRDCRFRSLQDCSPCGSLIRHPSRNRRLPRHRTDCHFPRGRTKSIVSAFGGMWLAPRMKWFVLLLFFRFFPVLS